MGQTPQIVIGLGSGRCGTQSLAAWLNRQDGAHVSHEMHGPAIAWEGSQAAVDETICRFQEQTALRLVGDVASYYLPYVERILARDPRIRFVCLKRGREETVVSFVKKTPGKNHWVEQDGVPWKRNRWDRCFPKYRVSDKAEAIGRYWDDYYRRAAELQTEFPHAFRVFEMDMLNSEVGQRKILDFLAVPSEIQRLAVGVRLNVAKPKGFRRLIRHVVKLAGRAFPRGRSLQPADARGGGLRRAA